MKVLSVMYRYKFNRGNIAISIVLFSVFQAVSLFAFSQRVWMPALFADQMILQREKPIPLWGTVQPGQTVTVIFDNEKKSARADANGNWKVNLHERKAGGPYTISVIAKDTIRFQDVWIGDVWIASGQSNMEMPVAPNPWFTGVKDYQREVDNSADSLIRVFTVFKNSQPDSIQKDVGGKWLKAGKENTGSFTAAGYFFARNLRKELNVPIGIISTSWGASSAQAWVKKDVMLGNPALRSIVVEWEEVLSKYKAQKIAFEKDSIERSKGNIAGRDSSLKRPSMPWMAQKRPAALFNGMIAPLVHYGIKGVIWYQGEGNAEKPKQYDHLFPALINNWRQEWRQKNLPFLFVQLPNFKERQQLPVEDGWPYIRESQARALSLPGVGMAVATDLGEENDIHPKNKQAVGYRLALCALAEVYRKPGEYHGPVYKKSTIDNGRIILEFDTQSPLRIKDGDELKGFAIAGEDHRFVWAKARIVDKKVIVYSDEVKKPLAVRYGWANNPLGNLYSNNFPAAPFRTDNWIK